MPNLNQAHSEVMRAKITVVLNTDAVFEELFPTPHCSRFVPQFMPLVPERTMQSRCAVGASTSGTGV